MNIATTVGVLYPGELGVAIAAVLQAAGQRVITTLSGRSQQTRLRCEAAGLETRATLVELVDESDFVLSVVSPSAAVTTAEAFRNAASRPLHDVTYVDLNSISPATARYVAAVLDPAGVTFVDASIHGLAAQLIERGTLYLSGPDTQRVAALFGELLRVRSLGDEPGAASGFKLLLAGMSKGLVVMFLEMALAAQRQGVLSELIHEYRHYYPGVMEPVERLVPTYPRHAARRSDELREAAQMVRQLGLAPHVLDAAAEFLRCIGQLGLDDVGGDWPTEQFVAQIEHHWPEPDLQ